MHGEHARPADEWLSGTAARTGARVGARAAAYLLGAVVVVALAVARWRDPVFDRPLQLDELLTLEMYSIAGVDAAGVPRPLRRAADLERLPAATPMQLAAGVYRSLGVWREPNNHALNSLLIDAALAPGHADARRVRLAAFVGAVAAAVALAWVVGPVLGWHASVPFVAPLVLGTPYMLTYGATARGYTWAVALSLLLLGLLYRLRRAPDSLPLNAACLATGFALVVDLVTAVTGWVLPLYAAMLLRPPPAHAEATVERAWRRALVVQLVLLGAGLALYLLPHLPSVYASLRQYGVPRDRPAEFVAELVELFAPTAGWAVALAAGTALAMVLPWRLGRPTLGAVAVLTVAVTAVQLLTASRLPYARVLVQLLPVTWLGLAAAIAWALARLRPAWRGVATVAGASGVALAVGASAVGHGAVEDGRLVAIRALAAIPPRAPAVRAVLPPIVDYHWAKFLPEAWTDTSEPLGVQDPVELRVWVTRRDGRWGVSLGGGQREGWRPYACPSHGCNRLGDDLGVAIARGRLVRLDDDAAPATWIAWVLDPERLGADGSNVAAHLEAYRVPYLRRTGFVRVKADVVGTLRAVEFFPTTPDERERVRAAVADGRARFGGEAFAFVPDAGDRP